MSAAEKPGAGASAPDASFPGGEGEMGELIRSFDWSKTPLGPAEAWSPALRTMVSILLANRFPLLLWWGPQYIQIYNDSYRPILGTKHPAQALGRPVSQCWSEIWHILRPLIDRPFGGGAATWDDDIVLEINRRGFFEESHFTIAYSPVPDETVPSGIGGVLATVHEITEKVVAERRVVALRDLGARVSEAKTAEEACRIAAETLAGHSKDVPFVLFYLLDSERKRAYLAGAAGVERGKSISPLTVEVAEPGASDWPLTEALRNGSMQFVERLGERFGAVPPGPWSDPPGTAIVVPIPSSRAQEMTGFMVTGVSARLKLDEYYRDFFELARTQVAAAIANARAYEEEKRRAEALAELDRAKTTFFSNVSHEFRTPLTLMLGPAEDLLNMRRGSLSQEASHEVEVIHRNALRLQKLVNTLLEFSRLEAGRLQATYAPADLASLTSELASVFRSAIQRGGLRLLVHCEPLSEPIYVDRDMWEKIVLNLISNAFKFTLEGEIEVALREKEASVELSVRDTGVGIPDEDIPHLFERFHRVKGASARTHEGTGIGLALCSELIKLHGGSVRVESIRGRGTTFTVSLPKGRAHLPDMRIQASTGPASTPPGARPFLEEALRWVPDSESQPPEGGSDLAPGDGPAHAESQAGGGARPRVLWADDNADMRAYVRRLLSERYDVVAVADGEEALAAARARAPDLVLSDVMMPRIDGFGLLRALRADPNLRAVPVILLSARAGEEARVDGMEAGADDYLIKPFGARELLARVGAHLETARIRRDAAEAVRESESRLRAMVSQAAVGIVLADCDGRLLDVNPRFCEILGRSAGDLCGSSWKDLAHPDEWSCNEVLLGEVARGERPELAIETRCARGDGSCIWVKVAVTPVFDAAQRLQRLLAVVEDIHARKVAEEALRRSERRLATEAEALTRLNDLASRLWRIQSLREGLDEMLGATIELLGADMGNIQILDAHGGVLVIEAQRGFQAEFLDLFRELSSRVLSVCGRALCSGERVVIEDVDTDPLFEPLREVARAAGFRAVQTTPLIGRDGTPLGMLSTHWRSVHRPTEQDLSRLDLYVRQATGFIERCSMDEALREADRRKDEFLATLGHELRNPLAPVRNAVQILRLKGPAVPEVEWARDVVDRQVQQMTRLIDDLLDVSRITRDKLELRKERVALSAVVQGAAETSRPIIEQCGHKLAISLPPEEVYLHADLTRMAQALANLLNNAAKYTDRGGKIWLTATRLDHEVVVSVKDTGIGIPSDMLEKVFDMFTQVGRALDRAQGGLGIGLMLVKRLVEMHGGTIEALSDGPGKGSEFVVRLPILLDQASGLPLRDDERQRVVSPLGCRVLVVDDNRDAADTMCMVLQTMGGDVRTAYDGLEAVETAEEFRPDVMFLDLGLPKANGFEVARRIRDRSWGKETVIVALTGWGQEEDKSRSRMVGFDHHLVKPVSFQDLSRLFAGLAPRKN